MQSLGTKLYDSGRFPLWFRIPALVFGLFVLCLGAAIAAHGLFGVSLGVPMSDLHGSPLLGSLACFAIAAVWIFVWFAQLRILFDASRQELIVSTRGYVLSHERRIALAGSREFHIRLVRSGLASRTWRVSVDFTDGRTERLADIPSGAESLAELLRAATKLPVTKHEDLN